MNNRSNNATKNACVNKNNKNINNKDNNNRNNSSKIL